MVIKTSSHMSDNATIEASLSGMYSMVLNTPALLPALHDQEEWTARLEDMRIQKLAGYVDWLKLCAQGHEATNFTSWTSISPERQQTLTSLYRNPRQVDLLAAGILEQPQPGSVLGPILTCLLAHQFSTLRNSDRFWYENDIPPASFTKDQLSEIRKVTLAGLLCTNVPHLLSIQPRPFLQEDPYLNAQIGCDHFSHLSVETWREDSGELDSAQQTVSMELLKQAIRRAEDDVQRRFQTEYLLWSQKGGVDPKSPIGTAAAFSKPNKEAFLLANNSLLLEYASREIMNSINSKSRRRRQLDAGDNIIGFGPDLPLKDFLSDLDITSFLPSLTHPNDEVCHEENGPCDPRSPYRSFSGHCNNLERVNLGRSFTTFARLLPSVYENGISSPRMTSVSGVPLPSARLISSSMHPDISHLHNRYTLMVMQFAQFVDHDLTFTPVQRGFFASIPDCRSCDSPLTVHPECMPIPVPSGDPFYPQINITSGARVCLPFMRSMPGQQRLGSREQINQNTAYLDGSHIYGQDSCMARSLRSYGGRLNATIRHNGDKDLLPLTPVHPECKSPSGYCFIAGDGRASEQAGLTALHTIYMREHNRLVHSLHAVNPHWGDEKLYQTARRIAVAGYQHVVYNEFLPRLLGWNAINLYGLKLTPQGYSKATYSTSCNPNIVTEFAAAAYRIGHSLLRPHLPRADPQYQAVEPAILLRDVFFNPDVIHQRHMVDELIRGLVSTPMENLDQFITGEISNHLFEDRRIPHSGMDLPALNIQRARDHGIPSYNEYRALCNLKRATTWEDLSREIPAESIARFRRIYASVDDIDLFPGGLNERAVQGGLVGPTFACIIGLQFRQLKKCDRFWYESSDPILRFTEPQLAEIRKVQLSKVLCDNLDISGDIQRSVLDQPSDFLNPRLSCQSLPSIDVNAWRENAAQGCQIAGRTVPVGDTALPTPCTSCVCTAEGPQCASLRVHDCSQLMREAGRDAILRDEVCAAQCSSLLLSSPGPTLEALEDIVSLTTRKPITSRARDFLATRLIPPPLPGRRPNLRSFKLPDIFLGR
ncbi:chorion peroxidase isoform X2 [Homalodisca vitripennis]|uniref:chorion peroxidase isoform X2 n=1 Tax=Homalodisca vitripennis TaxID=197043 RepID=UPI001EEA6D17|nr:chorion peroxidase isoform X2 [Homalodisca vitripennis]